VAEGNLGALTPLVFTVTLSQVFTGVVRVDYATADGSATAGVDYTAASGTLSFLPGETSKQVTVLVTGDLDVEPDETFTVNLSNSKDASISDGQATGTIVNDDGGGPPPTPSVSISDVSVNEGNSGTTAFAFSLSLSAASAQTVTVDYATADGTATAGSDYAGASGTVTFAPGETGKQVTVHVNGDTSVEPDETFAVNLSNAAGATIADGQATGTIVNDDSGPPPTPSLSIDDVALNEGNSGTTNFTFTVTLSAASAQTVTVAVAERLIAGRLLLPSDLRVALID
jgi:hypothetical protein